MGWQAQQLENARSSDHVGGRGTCSLEHSESGRKPIEFHDATNTHESRGFCRVGECPRRGRVLRTLYLFGIGPSRRLGGPSSTRIDVVLETACPDHIAKHSGGAAVTDSWRSADHDRKGFEVFIAD